MPRTGILRAGGLCLLILSVTRCDSGWAQDQPVPLEVQEEQAFKEAVALVSASVVRIETVGGLDRIGRLLAGSGPSTGLIVSEDGYIVSSAFNFVAMPSSILVTLPDGRRLPAKLVATDHLKMLALLKIEASNLIPARAAPEDSARVGQWAIAVGRTLDMDVPSVSVGIISALHRVLGKAIQTDAKVSPVNYGGPLIDVSGSVLGVLVPLSPESTSETAGVEWYDSGIGFAIPMESAYAAVERMKQGKDLRPGLMGIALSGGDVYGKKPTIDSVRFGSPAELAGLKAGDVIVEIDGKEVNRLADLRQILGNKYADDRIRVSVKRGEETVLAEMALVAELLPFEPAFLGILPERTRSTNGAQPGVPIRQLYPGGPAEEAGLKPGDRITRFNDTPVSDPASLLTALNRARPNDRVKLVYLRGDREATLEISLRPIPDSIPEAVRSAAIPPVKENGPAATDLKTGRFAERMQAYEHDYWAYVPETYNPEYTYGLMVWIHPAGDPMEAAVYQAWKPICQRRGIILLAPKAEDANGWTPDEAQFVQDLVKEFQKRYSIDANRIFLHTFATGGGFAYHLAFKHRSLFRGVAAVAAPLTAFPPENEPQYRLQWHFVCGERDDQFAGVERTVQVLRKMKYPVSFTTLKAEARAYPGDDQVREIGRWADLLDRI